MKKATFEPYHDGTYHDKRGWSVWENTDDNAGDGKLVGENMTELIAKRIAQLLNEYGMIENGK